VSAVRAAALQDFDMAMMLACCLVVQVVTLALFPRKGRGR
jgi:hypothetical protein